VSKSWRRNWVLGAVAEVNKSLLGERLLGDLVRRGELRLS